MGKYVKGDVLLASVALDDRTPAKTRPAVVIETEVQDRIRVCPVSSKQPSDSSSIPISIDEFSSGGLDLFQESYVMTSRVLTIHLREVIGKKGRLTAEVTAEIAGRVSGSVYSGSATGKKTGVRGKDKSP